MATEVVNPFHGDQQALPGKKGLTFDVSNLSYGIVHKGCNRTLLKRISFHLEPGAMVALMGPSGAGKSTLLDLLADRKLDGLWSGDILVNQYPRTDWFNRDSAYVLQNDILIGFLTVAETIRYSARTRLPEGTSDIEIENRVDRLLTMMGLVGVKDSLVGDTLNKGISGGQMKRLSIAVEIVNLPLLIFLDEPTTGLDSSMALEVMQVVKKLTQDSRTCVSTIHQPSPDVFDLFDQVAMLIDGRLVYFGPGGDLTSYFTNDVLQYDLEPGKPIVEFIMDICGGTEIARNMEEPRTVDDLVQLYESSKYPALCKPHERLGLNPPLTTYLRKHATNRVTEIRMLLHRSYTVQKMDKGFAKRSILRNLIIAGVSAFLYAGKGNLKPPLYTSAEDPTSRQLTMTTILFFLVLYSNMSNNHSVPVIANRISLFRRELASYAYAASSYWVVMLLEYVPLLFISHLVFVTVIYFALEFPLNFGYYAYFLFILFFGVMTSYYMALAITSATGSTVTTLAIIPNILLFFNMFAGFTIVIGDIPAGWHWASYVSLSRWMFQGLMRNEYNSFENGDDTYGDGDEVLDIYSFHNYTATDCMLILLLYMVLMSVMVYFSVRPVTSHLKWVSSIPEDGSPSGNAFSGSRDSTQSRDSGNPMNRKKLRSDMLQGENTLRNSVAKFRLDSGMNVSSDGHRLVFDNICYQVGIKTSSGVTSKSILKGISGYCNHGEMLAIMGPSGAGKSTLLDILADRKTTGELSGKILFNGSERDVDVMRHTAYVMQDNVHFGELTVRETLIFAARLRINDTTAVRQIESQVNKILDMLDLEDIADSTVGDDKHRGISGGEMKRLSIGTEIVAMPNLIYLDEPTSGLDASKSLDVMAACRNLANQNLTIICTIHQPSLACYSFFDNLLLLAKGEVVYFGSAKNVVNYFQSSPYAFPFGTSTDQNPANYFISIASEKSVSKTGQIISSTTLIDYFASSEYGRTFRNTPTVPPVIAADFAVQVSPSRNRAVDIKLYRVKPSYSTSVYAQCVTLITRVATRLYRKPRVALITMMRHIILGLFYGSLFYNLSGGTDSAAYTNRMSLMFFCLTFMMFGHAQAVPALFRDRAIFYRERGARLYGAFPYWLSTMAVLIPIVCFDCFMFSSIMYHMVGLNDAPGRFSFFYGVCLLCSITGLYLSQFIASISPTPQAAITMLPIAFFLAIAGCGYLVYLPLLPVYLGSWVPYVSYVRWGFQALILNEFVGNDALPNYQDYIDFLGFDTHDKEFCGDMVFIFTGLFATLLYVTLKFKSYEKR